MVGCEFGCIHCRSHDAGLDRVLQRTEESIQHAPVTPHLVMDLSAIQRTYQHALQKAIDVGLTPEEEHRLENIVRAHTFCMALRDHIRRTTNAYVAVEQLG